MTVFRVFFLLIVVTAVAVVSPRIVVQHRAVVVVCLACTHRSSSQCCASFTLYAIVPYPSAAVVQTFHASFMKTSAHACNVLA